MNKKQFFNLVDTLTVFLVAGFLIKTGIDKKTASLLSFITDNGLSFIKWGGAMLALYSIGYLVSSKIRGAYWGLITLTLLLSNLNKSILNLTK